MVGQKPSLRTVVCVTYRLMSQFAADVNIQPSVGMFFTIFCVTFIIIIIISPPESDSLRSGLKFYL